ncbi:hypothetical protein NMY22_g18062 [Coprinellus aureogranulatus]|nr:hypothetical protein NMY22_g18062 [Coprinellus aureogranulatus]
MTMQIYNAVFPLGDAGERYTIYRAIGAPEHDCMPGDLYIDAAANNQVWVRYDGVWTPASLPQPEKTVPEQKHPKHGNDWRLKGFNWVYRRQFYADNTRSRRSSRHSQVELSIEYMFGYHDPFDPTNARDSHTPSPPLPLSVPSSPLSYVSAENAEATPFHGNMPQLNHSPSIALTIPSTTALPLSAKQSGDLPATPPYSAVNEANAWLGEVRDLCFNGPASRAPGQLAKIDSVFRALMSKEVAIDRIRAVTGEMKSGCVLVGPATRDGPPPSVRGAVEDILSSPTLQFSDTTTNTVEADVSCRDFIAQQISLGMGETLPVGHRLLVVFDVPLTESGLGRCRWAYLPFKDDGLTSFCDATNCWTPAGSLTLPHIDDFACGQFMIHWKGKKLWLLWPGTAANLRLMEFTHLTSGDLSTTLMLIDQLEGLQLLYLTEEEFGEYTFYLRIATIHCCISVTESCHAGRPVRSIISTFIPDLDIAYGSAMDWMEKRLLGSSGCDEARKREIVELMVGSINHWLNLYDGLKPSPRKNKLKAILDRTCVQLDRVGRALGLDLDVL